MARGDLTVKIYRRLGKKRYLRGKHVYVHERICMHANCWKPGLIMSGTVTKTNWLYTGNGSRVVLLRAPVV